MFLSDVDIQTALLEGRLVVHGGPEKAIQPSSVELHLGATFKEYQRGYQFGAIDPLQEQDLLETDVSGYGDPMFQLDPLGFALAHTMETVGVDRTLAAQVDGKSSLARLGLQVHMTSGFIDPGFTGQITLELFNATSRPIILRPGMTIAQMFIVPMSSPCQRPYGSPGIDSKYQGQMGATPARLSGRDYVRLQDMDLREGTVEGQHRMRPLPAWVGSAHEPPVYPRKSLEWLEG